MKNFLIGALIAMIGILAYVNRNLLLSLNQISNQPLGNSTTINVTTPPAPTPISGAAPIVNTSKTVNSNQGGGARYASDDETISAQTEEASSEASASSAAANSDQASKNSADIAYLKYQIQQAGSGSIDQRIASTQNEINTLKGQLQTYQGAERAQLSATAQFQIRQSMNQQMVQHLTDQIQSLERQERMINRNYAWQGGSYDVNSMQPAAADVQAKLAAYQTQIQNLSNQRDQLSTQNLQQASDTSQEMVQSKNNLDAATNAIKNQIAFLQQEVTRLNDEKKKSAENVSFLKKELERNMQGNKNQSSNGQ